MNSNSEPQVDQPGKFSLALPDLPSVIRYYDDFTDNLCSIEHPSETDIWSISLAGANRHLDFDDFISEFRPLIKHWCASALQTHAVATANIRLYGLRSVTVDDFRLLAMSTPSTVRTTWKILIEVPPDLVPRAF